MSHTILDPPSVVPRRAVPEVPALAAVRRLAVALESIRYCHWKSNAHLPDSVAGTTDLDLLVARADAQPLAVALATAGFKRFAAVPHLAYPAVEDYLALDAPTGRLVHLHLHYELTLGERHLKGYHLPWEAELLGSRRLDHATDLYVADPTLEFLLLLVRGALKLRARDRALALVRGAAPDAGFRREYHWLDSRVDRAALSAVTLRLLGPGAADLIGGLGAAPPSLRWLLAFRRRAGAELRGCRTYGAAGARLRRAWRELRALAGAADRRWIHSTHRRVRTDPRGGCVVALLGCDGAGKSTLAARALTWLSWKLDAAPVYLGSGDGPASGLRRLLRPVHRLIHRGGRPAGASVSTASPGLARAVWALAVSHEKRRKLAGMVRARNRGLIVVCDRYPQAQIPGFTDGPLLSAWRRHPRAMARALARWEAAPYEWADRHPPDLVIKLQVSPGATLSRKPGMHQAEAQRRVEAVRRLRFPPSARVVEIDADAPFDQVLRQVKRAVWDEL